MFPGNPSPGAVTGHWSLTDNPHLLKALEFSGEAGLFASQNSDSSNKPLRFDLVFCGPQNFSTLHWVYMGWMELSAQEPVNGVRQVSFFEEHVLGPDDQLEWQKIRFQGSHHADQFSSIPDNVPWKVSFQTLGQPDQAAHPFASWEQSSILESSTSHRLWTIHSRGLNNIHHRLPVDVPLVTTAGLVDASRHLQKFPGRQLHFSLFRNGTSYCPGQRLKALEPVKFSLCGHSLRLSGCVHTGTGHLPTFFWFDESGCLYAIRRGVLCYFRNPNPVLKGKIPHAA